MPIGPYEDFGECLAAQQAKGNSRDEAERICGELEARSESAKGQVVEQYTTQSGKFYVRAFLIDHSLTRNNDRITEESLRRNIGSFVGKPLIMTEDFTHPDTPTEQNLSQWLQAQEPYRVGTIKEIIPRENALEGGTSYYAIIEVTDPALQEHIHNNKGPVYVSPAIAEFIGPVESSARKNGLQAPEIVANWTALHLAIVSEPAFGIKKAVISETCGGDEKGCLMQLRKASVSCNFCKYKALRRYSTLVSLSLHAKTYTSHPSQSSHLSKNSMSQLEALDSTGTSPSPGNANSEDKTAAAEKMEQPTINKQPIPVPQRVMTLAQAMEELQNKDHVIQLQNIKIQELTEANGTITDRVAALEMQGRRKEIERIVTSDVIKDDKSRLEKIKYLTNSDIPINQIEELYKELKVVAKKANLNQRSYSAKVPYVAGSSSSSQQVTQGSIYSQSDSDEPTLAKKQLAALTGRIF